MFTTEILAALGALVAGVAAAILAFKTVGNRRPHILPMPHPGDDTIAVINGDRDHQVFIGFIVNQTGRSDLSVTVEGLPSDQGTPYTLNAQSVPVGVKLSPGNRLMLHFYGEDGSFPEMIRFTVERETFNYLSSLPVFHVVVRPMKGMSLVEAGKRLLRFVWQFVHRYKIILKHK